MSVSEIRNQALACELCRADLPNEPKPIFIATWHERFLSQCSAKLVVCIGRYAQQHYLPEYATLTEGVHDFEGLLPNKIVLPHPSGRNNRWLSKHDWFATGLVPKLKQRINELM